MGREGGKNETEQWKRRDEEMYGGGKGRVPVIERREAVFNQVLCRAVVKVRVVLVDHALESAAAQEVGRGQFSASTSI